MVKHLIRSLTVMCLLAASGCGFQLRGTDLGHLESLSIVGSGTAPVTARSFRQALSDRGVDIVTGETPVLTVHLLDERSERRSIATTDVFDAAEYELRLEVDVSISRGDAVLLPETTFISQRTYAVDSNNLAASYEEQSMLLAAMRADLAEQLIRRIEYLTGPAS